MGPDDKHIVIIQAFANVICSHVAELYLAPSRVGGFPTDCTMFMVLVTTVR